jgi:ketosteroid isomerase-like protein
VERLRVAIDALRADTSERDWEATLAGAWVELVEAGDRVVGLFRQRMRGHYTGIDVASGNYAMVFTFRDGPIVHARFYARRAEALEAVGLRD